MLDEKLDGETFRLKASIKSDPKRIEEAVKELIVNRKMTFQFNGFGDNNSIAIDNVHSDHQPNPQMSAKLKGQLQMQWQINNYTSPSILK